MFGWNFRKSLKEKMLGKKLIEVNDKKINLLNCKDDEMSKLYQSCFNRKQRRLVLKQYLKTAK